MKAVLHQSTIYLVLQTTEGEQHKMKKEFSTSWISSKQPRKQRKYRANAPLHTKHKFLSAHLSKSLREKYGKRSFPLRKGDEVLVMRGSSYGKKAKIASVNYKTQKIYLEGIQRSKRDGSKILIPFSPRSLQIQALDLSDKERRSSKEKLSNSQGEKNASDKERSDK